jgi:hypothetical protein
MQPTSHFYDANMLLSVRFAGAAGSQRKSLSALWLIVRSKLTDNEREYNQCRLIDTELDLKYKLKIKT